MKLIGKLRAGPALWVGLAALLASLDPMSAAQPSVHALQRGLKTGYYSFNGYPQDVKVTGSRAYVVTSSGSLAVFDVSTPTNLVYVGGYQFPGSATGLRVALSADHAFMTLRSFGFFAINIRNPSNCVWVSSCNTGGWASDIALAGNHAYVANGRAGLRIVDVRNPTNCVAVGAFYTGGWAEGVAVAGNYAYLADGNLGLQVIDVSDPANCVLADSCATSGYAIGVAVSGNYAYVVDSNTGLNIIDVSIRTNCVRVGGHFTDRDAHSVVVSGNRAYVANGESGLWVIDVTNPTNCVLLGRHDTSGRAYGVTVADARIYVADSFGGLLVLPTLPNVQFTVRVDAATNQPFTLEAATDLAGAGNWSPLVTTNVPAMPFDFVDFDVKLAEKPRKFYRVRQP